MKLKKKQEVSINEVRIEIKKMKKILSEINFFTAEQNNYFTQNNDFIDERMKANNEKSEKYIKKRQSIPEIPQDDLLDVLSEHVQINHLKVKMLTEYIEDIYSRLDRMGSSINNSITTIGEFIELQEENK